MDMSIKPKAIAQSHFIHSMRTPKQKTRQMSGFFVDQGLY